MGSFFNQEWKNSWYNLKRRAGVEGNKIWFITVPDEIAGKITWIRGLIDDTNKAVDEENRRREEQRQRELQEEEKHEADIKHMRDALKK